MIFKKNSILLFITFFFSICYINAQDLITLSGHQDFKLLTIGDERGNAPGTLNLITTLKHEATQQKLGFYVFGIDYEKANIKDGYERYSGFVGYTFNFVFNDPKLKITPAINYGKIVRRGKTSSSISGTIQTAYNVSKKVRLSTKFQYKQRSDLKIAYNLNVVRSSFFVGLEIALFETKKTGCSL
ncbi:hypothetical protein [uncultured Polaribacter sp.]|uniref:hypothetical protein n=1 Tax=uncultured Polaribacter sp. TaxID=174711 RepID=UPI00260E5F30|nr:hypothetical protein [uncultured Polaribacter sp.]